MANFNDSLNLAGSGKESLNAASFHFIYEFDQLTDSDKKAYIKTIAKSDIDGKQLFVDFFSMRQMLRLPPLPDIPVILFSEVKKLNKRRLEYLFNRMRILIAMQYALKMPESPELDTFTA